MKPLPLSFVAALGFLLAGCFTSQTPKFPLASAVPLFGDGGRYIMFEHSGGEWRRQGPLVVKRIPDGSYEFIAEKSTLPISVHDIGNGRHIGQARPDGKPDEFAYVLLTKSGAEVISYLPQCDRQDRALLTAHGVTFGKYECVIDKVNDPAKLFAALIPGDPVSKLAPE